MNDDVEGVDPLEALAEIVVQLCRQVADLAEEIADLRGRVSLLDRDVSWLLHRATSERFTGPPVRHQPGPVPASLEGLIEHVRYEPPGPIEDER